MIFYSVHYNVILFLEILGTFIRLIEFDFFLLKTSFSIYI
jgi:hypothetical protein